MYDAAIPEEWTAGPAREDTRQPGPVRVREPIRSAASGRGPEKALLQVRDLRTLYYERRGLTAWALGRERGAVRAVDGVDLEIRKGRDPRSRRGVCSGKTTLGETILRLVTATAGEVLFDGRDVRRMSRGELRRLRRRAQMIFQDPYSSLSPRQRVASLLAEPYKAHDVPPQEGTPPRAPRSRRALARAPEEIPAPALRRPSAKGRHRPRPGSSPGVPRRGRAHRRARRLRRGRDPQPYEGAAGSPGAHLSGHHPQPQPGRLLGRPDRRHVPRPDRRGRARRAYPRGTGSPLHPRPRCGRLRAGPAPSP